MRTLQIFISSPGDVAEERAVTRRILQRLQKEFTDRGTLVPIFWEHEPLLATETFQEQIVRPSDTDIVICLLWSRIGTRLPGTFTREDGSHYDSGTEFEFEDALRGYRESGRPDLLVYRKTADPLVSLHNRQALLERLGQKEALDRFVERWFHNRDDGTLDRAFHLFSDLSEFEGLLEIHLRKLLDRRLPRRSESGEIRLQASWLEGSPFRGLHVYDFDHAPIFFGRTRAISEILEALRAQAAQGRPFLLVLGPSGSGKSSLVRAGVLPILTQPGVIEGVGLWRRALLRPGDTSGDLCDGLAAALLRGSALPELDACGVKARELAELLRLSPEAVSPLLKTALSLAEGGHSNPPASCLVVVLDQLEEIFTRKGVTQAERRGFARALQALVNSGRVWVLGTLRSDFYPHLNEVEPLFALKGQGGHYDVLPPTATEMRQLIRYPAQAAGLGFARDPKTGEGLDETLADTASRNPNSLPLLQFLLHELYERRTREGLLNFEDYHDLGGLEGALARRAEEVFASLDAPVQATLPRVLRSLVHVGPGDDAPTLARVPISQVAATSQTRTLVDAFVNARLFVTELGHHDTPVVGLAHEALIAHWPRLRAWLAEDRESLGMFQRVSEAASLWEDRGRTGDFLLQEGRPLGEATELERRWGADLPAGVTAFIAASLARMQHHKRVRRLITAVLALLSTVALGLALVTNQSRREADRRRGEAEELITFMLVDLRDHLADIGRLDLYADIGEKALDYFARQSKVSDALLAQRALALRQVGIARKRQGDAETARARFVEYQSLSQRLVEQHPQDLDFLAQLADSHYRLGSLAWESGTLDLALEQFRRQLEATKTLAEREPAEPRWQLQLAYCYTNMGQIQRAEWNLTAALEEFTKALAINEAGYEARPDDPKAHVELAWSLANVALVETDLGRFDQAVEHYRRDLALKEGLYRGDPRGQVRLQDLAATHRLLGETLEARGEWRAARQHSDASRDLLMALVERDPTDLVWQRQLVLCYLSLGREHRMLGEEDLSLERLRQAQATQAELTLRETRKTKDSRLDAILRLERGMTLLTLRRLQEALDEALAARQLLEPLAGLGDSQGLVSTLWLSQSYLLEARVQELQGLEGPAAKRHAQAKTLWREVSERKVIPQRLSPPLPMRLPQKGRH